jgi:hypothetical protein
MITRRCTQQQFLMRPDEATNNNFLYCLGEAAQRFGIVLLLSQMLSNHHHTDVYDPHGRINEFTEHFHKMFASTGDRKSDPHSGHIWPRRLVSGAWHSDLTRNV